MGLGGSGGAGPLFGFYLDNQAKVFSGQKEIWRVRSRTLELDREGLMPDRGDSQIQQRHSNEVSFEEAFVLNG
ncbi:hypothetical protein K788_0007337 (plasmid) [Paraburkholderia caribensis MBA4]|uniref:Uncharacterized protein n=1 Tax=Paraburkholderia caribensis MBA4 TaxID=1323664 RepID=A0A0P0RRI4_9BURK|nr:hypothetical protein K788_0007337 [Paraburkholderia caribensis MBA4]